MGGLVEGVGPGWAIVPVLLPGHAAPLYYQIIVGESHLVPVVSLVRVDLIERVIIYCGHSVVLLVRLITKLGSDLELCTM